MGYNAQMVEKLQSIIDRGRTLLPTVMGNIQNEFDNRKDFIVKPEAIKFDVNGQLKAKIGTNGNSIETNFTDHSRGQLLTRINMPTRFYDKLVSYPDMKDLAAVNIERLMQKFGAKGLMFRVINAPKGMDISPAPALTKGVLSPSFGRYDASPLFTSFIEQAVGAGYVPMDAYNTSYRYSMTFLLPEIVEVAPNEYIVFAITFQTSDYGVGANDISLSVLRIVCTNLAVGFGLLRKVHIGSRFSDVSAFVEMSETTHSLDVRTIASAIGDVVKKSTDMIPVFKQKLISAAEPNKEYNVNRVLANVTKTYGTEIAESAKTLYNQVGLQELPEVPGAWRMSNVLSLLAHSAKNEDTKLDLQRSAFDVLGISSN